MVRCDKKLPIRAGIAQLVEQLIRNQQVSGSSPLAGSILFLKSSILSNVVSFVEGQAFKKHKFPFGIAFSNFKMSVIGRHLA